MSNRTNSLRAHLGFESLETREVYAANLTQHLAGLASAALIKSMEQAIRTMPLVDTGSEMATTAKSTTTQKASVFPVVLLKPREQAASTMPLVDMGSEISTTAKSTTMQVTTLSNPKSSYNYTAATIRNNSNVTVNYSYKWNGNNWTKYSLAPGQSRVHYTSSLNQKATISFDKSFASGVQEQSYTLTGRNVSYRDGFYLVAPTPSISDGKLYTFSRVTNGIQLYTA